MVGTNDPLRDNSFLFTLKLAKLGVDVELKEMYLLPHGFLSYDFPYIGMRAEATEGIKMAT